MDRDAYKARALVIAGNPGARSLMVAQLHDLGLQDVRSSSRLSEARLMLERQEYDIVLCDDDLDTKGRSAQELLDELRREQLMPYGTVFILITAEATFARITEAAEGGLDSVLVRPYTATALGERLAEARRRKRTLQPIFDAAQGGRGAEAQALCLTRWRDRMPYALFCARLAAEWMLRDQNTDAARALFEDIQAREPQPWAQLGVARSRWAAGDIGGARRLVDAQVNSGNGGADACDLLGRLLVEQGEFGSALEVMRRAVQLTPHCLLRLQQAGTL
ncbi:MAG: response regulator, partial [Aquabacterium sp.]